MLRLVPFEFLFLQVDVKLSVFPFSERWLQISLHVGVCFASHADVVRVSSGVPPPRISGGTRDEALRTSAWKASVWVYEWECLWKATSYKKDVLFVDRPVKQRHIHLDSQNGF